MRSVVHLPDVSIAEPLRPAGALTAWGLRVLRVGPLGPDVRLDLVLRHADGGDHLRRARVVGCLPVFGSWHVVDARFEEAVMPLDWIDPMRWQPWRGPGGDVERIGRHPQDTARVLRVRPRSTGSMLVARPDAVLGCDDPEAPAGVDVLSAAEALPALLLRDLRGQQHRDRAARRLLVATAADDWNRVRSVARAIRGYATGHDDDELADAARQVLAIFDTDRPELQRQIVLARLVETLLAA